MESKPTLEEFDEEMRSAVRTVLQDDGVDILDQMKKEGPDFNYAQGGLDSLDMLDIMHEIHERGRLNIDLNEVLGAESGDITTRTLHEHASYASED